MDALINYNDADFNSGLCKTSILKYLMIQLLIACHHIQLNTDMNLDVNAISFPVSMLSLDLHQSLYEFSNLR